MTNRSRPVITTLRIQPFLQRTPPFRVATDFHFFLQLWQTDAISLSFSLPTLLLRTDLVVFVFELEIANRKTIRKDIRSVHFATTVDYIIGYHLTFTFFPILLINRYQLKVDIWVLLATANTETLMPLSGKAHAVVDLGWVAAVFEDNC